MSETTEAVKETPTEVSENVGGPVITTEKKSTEVLDSNGKSMPSDTPLSKIFDAIASGDKAEDAIKSVMTKDDAPAPGIKEEEPEVEPTPTITIEKKKEEAAAPVVEPPKEETKNDIAEEELQVLPHDKPKTAQRISALLKKSGDALRLADETKKDAELKAKRIQELEDRLKAVESVDPLTNEKVKTHLEELGMYRRRYELEASPEVKEKFDSKVADAEETIHKSLLSQGASQGIIDIVKEEGGWLKFVDSQRQIPLSDGKSVSAAELAELIRTKLPVSERRRLDALEIEQIRLARDKQTYFNEESKKAKDYFATREQREREQAEAHNKAVSEASKVVAEWRSRFQQENEWLKEKELAANLTKDQIKQLEEHNAHAKQLNSLIDKHLSANNVNDMLNVLVDAIKYHQERRNLAQVIAENTRLKDEVKATKEQLDKFKKGGASLPKSGSLAAAASTAVEKSNKPDSLEAAFEALAEGRTLG